MQYKYKFSYAAILLTLICAPLPASAQDADSPIATNPILSQASDMADETLDMQTLPGPKKLPPAENFVLAVAPAGLLFASFDSNSNYSVDQQELFTGQSRAFVAADKNGNKTLTVFELNSWRERALGNADAAPRMIAFDSNYDQKITRAEFNHALTNMFGLLDKNEDGTADYSELLRKVNMPKRGERIARTPRSDMDGQRTGQDRRQRG